MTDILSSAGALDIHGCERPRLAKAVERAAAVPPTGWGGAAVPAAGLMELRGEIVRYTEDTVRGVAARRGGDTRFVRTRRLAAAHAVIVVSAYFEAARGSHDRRTVRKLGEPRRGGHPGGRAPQDPQPMTGSP